MAMKLPKGDFVIQYADGTKIDTKKRPTPIGIKIKCICCNLLTDHGRYILDIIKEMENPMWLCKSCEETCHPDFRKCQINPNGGRTRTINELVQEALT